MSTVDFLSKEGVARLWQTIKDYAISNELLAQPSGVATLDEFGKVLQKQLPDYILGQVLFGGTIDGDGVATLTTLFKNRYNLSVATLDVDNLTASNYEGSYFIATANGVSGIAKTLDIVVGDWVISNGSEWTKIDNTDAVRTVLGLKGDIQAPDLRNAMLGKSGNQGNNLALGDIWMGNGDGTVVTHETSVFARSILGGIAENTMFSKLWADRATNDSNGKNIANTYMPFTGGTFTGDVTHNANVILANSKVIVGKDTKGDNISLLSLNSSNQVVIGYGAHNKYDTLLYGNKITAYGDFYGLKGVSAKGIADFGVGGSSGGNGGAHYDLLIDHKNDRVTLQLKGDDGDIDTKDMLAFSTTRAGVVPNAPSTKSVLFGGGWKTLDASDIPSLDWSKIATGKPTTLGGYGITDAYTKSQIENGVFPDMRVGLADDLGDIEETLDEEYTFQPTANPNEIRDGYAQIESLKGNSLVWNQLVQTVGQVTSNGVVFSIVDGVVTIKGTATATCYFNLFFKTKANHKYICSPLPSLFTGATSAYIYNDGHGLALTTSNRISTANDANTTYIRVQSGVTIDETFPLQIHDLTQMFGEGYEPTTVEEFERRCPKGMSNDYNEGEVIHFNGDIKSVGFNQWDEEWRVGAYNSQGQYINGEFVCNTNPIRIVPNSTYWRSIGSSYTMVCYWFDQTMNFLGLTYIGSNAAITPLPNSAWMNFRMQGEYGSTYNHDICINISNLDKNGTYEPYTEFRRDLPTEIFEGGMKGWGTAYDEVYWDKTKRTNVKVQRFGKVDWETASLYYNDTLARFQIDDLNKLSGSNNIIASIYIESYSPIVGNKIDKTISGYSENKNIYIYDFDYTDVDTYRAAMIERGIEIYYELAEPIIEEIDIPYMDYQVSNDGTEEIVSSTPTTPIKARVTYNFDTIGTVRQNRFDISNLKIDLKSNYQPLATAINTGNIGQHTLIVQNINEANAELPLNRYGLIQGVGAYVKVGFVERYSIAFRSLNGTLQSKVKQGDDADWKTIAFTDSTVEGAKKDGDGNVIKDTYLKLSGGRVQSEAFNPLTIKRLGILGAAITFENINGVLGNIGVAYDTKAYPIYGDGTKNYALLHEGNTNLTLDTAYNWEDKNSQTNKQVYGFTLNVNGTEIGMSAITKEELDAILV